MKKVVALLVAKASIGEIVNSFFVEPVGLKEQKKQLYSVTIKNQVSKK